MSECRYCGQQAGIFSAHQNDCRNNYVNTIKQLSNCLSILEMRAVVDKSKSISFMSAQLNLSIQKNEDAIFVFDNVNYYENKNICQFVRTGMSYTRYPQHTPRIVAVDVGSVLLTDKHLYFKGTNKAFRIAYSKLLSVSEFNLRKKLISLEICKATQNARYQYFIFDEFMNEVQTNAISIIKCLCAESIK